MSEKRHRKFRTVNENIELLNYILANLVRLQDMNLDYMFDNELGEEWRESQIEWWKEKYKEVVEECKAYGEFSKQMLERLESEEE